MKYVLMGICLLFLINEYLIYFFAIYECQWPVLSKDNVISHYGNTSLKVMFLADTHLVGFVKGHWFDRLRREWQMKRAFQTTLSIHNPNVIFIAGDLFDEGFFSSDEAFDNHLQRFHNIFKHDSNVQLYSAVGNHDIGYHYRVHPHVVNRFEYLLNSSSVQLIKIAGNNFVILNSVAFEGDDCEMCRSTRLSLQRILEKIKCKKIINHNECISVLDETISRPILILHYPLYRESEEICNESDAAPLKDRSLKFKEKWDCLSKKASNQLLKKLNPRLIISGHTHNGCFRRHSDETPEWTVSSFNWRNRNDPTFLMGSIAEKEFTVSKCFLPKESTVINIYVIGFSFVFICIFFKIFKWRLSNKNKVHSS